MPGHLLHGGGAVKVDLGGHAHLRKGVGAGRFCGLPDGKGQTAGKRNNQRDQADQDIPAFAADNAFIRSS